ncbi:MAG: VacJ family lipoprotein, partial [Pseudomonas sp.]
MPITKPAPLLVRSTVIVALAALASGCTSTPTATPGSCESVPFAVHDPAEPVNRGIFAFNRAVDDYA